MKADICLSLYRYTEEAADYLYLYDSNNEAIDMLLEHHGFSFNEILEEVANYHHENIDTDGDDWDLSQSLFSLQCLPHRYVVDSSGTPYQSYYMGYSDQKCSGIFDPEDRLVLIVDLDKHPAEEDPDRYLDFYVPNWDALERFAPGIEDQLIHGENFLYTCYAHRGILPEQMVKQYFTRIAHDVVLEFSTVASSKLLEFGDATLVATDKLYLLEDAVASCMSSGEMSDDDIDNFQQLFQEQYQEAVILVYNDSSLRRKRK